MSDKPERLEWWRNYEYVSDPSRTSPTTDAFGNPYKSVFNADNVPNIPIDLTGNWHSPESAYALFLEYSSLMMVWINDTGAKPLVTEEPVTLFGVPIVHTNFMPLLDPDTPILRILRAEHTRQTVSGIITFDVPHNAGVQIPLTMPASAMPKKKSRKKKDETP